MAYSLADLPSDVVHIIAAHLLPSDIISLCYVSSAPKEVRSCL